MIANIVKDWKRFLNFCLAGTLVFIVQLTITVLMTEIWHFWSMTSFAVSLIIGIMINFSYNLFITFRSKKHFHKRFIKFLALSLAFSFFIWLAVYLLVSLGMYYIISIIIVSTIATILSFDINRRWIFN